MRRACQRTEPQVWLIDEAKNLIRILESYYSNFLVWLAFYLIYPGYIGVGLPKELCKVECAAFDIFPNSISWEVSKPKSNHISTFKSYDFSPNLKVIAQKMSLPCPWEVWKGQGHGRLIFHAAPFKFKRKLNSHVFFNW